MAANDLYFSFKFKDKPYKIANGDVTNQRLKQLKQWFGREYGSFTGFPQLVIQEWDVDAWAGMIWIAQQVAGEAPGDPRAMEFTLDDLELWIEEPVEEEPDPLEQESSGDIPALTFDSPDTASTSSEASISSGSPISSE